MLGVVSKVKAMVAIESSFTKTTQNILGGSDFKSSKNVQQNKLFQVGTENH